MQEVNQAVLSKLKPIEFLPNSSFNRMHLKDFENAEDQASIKFWPSSRSKIQVLLSVGFLAIFGGPLFAQSPTGTTTEVAKFAMKLPEKALLKIDPKVVRMPAGNRGSGAGTGSVVSERNSIGTGMGEYAWKVAIATTVFWVGEQATVNNPISNDQSAWDSGWVSSYGGMDSPNSEDRANFVPASFVPHQNPFYVALPYNDIDDHHTKPEAAQVIPWFKSAFVRDGQSVCKGRWLAIRHGRKVCYAQWEDVGPFQTDHWQYVFGNERPRPNRNRDAGLDVSPAVREYLGLDNTDFCDWKFVDLLRVPTGPWTVYGENNIFSRLRRPKATSMAVSQRQKPSF